MKINKSQLLEIIKEEVRLVILEQDMSMMSDVEDDEQAFPDASIGMSELPPEEQQSMMRTTMPGMEDMPTMADLAAKKKKAGRKAINVVRDAQRELDYIGYDLGSGGVDGKLGPDTVTAFNQFRKDIGERPLSLKNLKAIFNTAGAVAIAEYIRMRAPDAAIAIAKREMGAIGSDIAGKASKDRLQRKMAVAAGGPLPDK